MICGPAVKAPVFLFFKDKRDVMIFLFMPVLGLIKPKTVIFVMFFWAGLFLA